MYSHPAQLKNRRKERRYGTYNSPALGIKRLVHLCLVGPDESTGMDGMMRWWVK
jgi:hypothetical protein